MMQLSPAQGHDHSTTSMRTRISCFHSHSSYSCCHHTNPAYSLWLPPSHQSYCAATAILVLTQLLLPHTTRQLSCECGCYHTTNRTALLLLLLLLLLLQPCHPHPQPRQHSIKCSCCLLEQLLLTQESWHLLLLLLPHI